MAFLLQADELDGEIDLRSCTDVTEYAVQRNYGFQIHVRPGAAAGGAAWLEGPPEEVLVWSMAPHQRLALVTLLPRDPVLRTIWKLCASS